MGDEKPTPEGGGGGSWPSQLIKILATKPLSWIFAIIGLGLIVFALATNSEAFKQYKPAQPLYVIAGGISALITAAVLWFVQRLTITRSVVEKRRLARLFIAVLGASVLSVILVFALVPGLRTTQIREIADPILLALLMASWGGLMPVYWTSTLLEDIPSKLDERLKAVERTEKDVAQRISAQLEKLDLRERELVNHVEDATRTLLPGFTKVFHKALWMLQHAEREIWMVNFNVNFGSPHLYNSKVKKDYCTEFGGRETQLQEHVNEFAKELTKKVVAVDTVQILTVSDDWCRSNFLRPLKERPGYGDLDVDQEFERAAKAKATLKHYINHSSGKIIEEVESLPIQLLIVGLPSENGSNDRRYGCLVFMVGTEILNTDLEPGKEPAFYTQLDSMVEVYKTLARALIRQAQRPRSRGATSD